MAFVISVFVIYFCLLVVYKDIQERNQKEVFINKHKKQRHANRKKRTFYDKTDNQNYVIENYNKKIDKRN